MKPSYLNMFRMYNRIIHKYLNYFRSIQDCKGISKMDLIWNFLQDRLSKRWNWRMLNIEQDI